MRRGNITYTRPGLRRSSCNAGRADTGEAEPIPREEDGWQHGPGDQGDRDLKFFDAVLLASMKRISRSTREPHLLDRALERWRFHYLLWAERGEAFAAFAPVAAAGGGYFLKAKPKPVFLMPRAKKDPLVKIEMQQRTLDHVKKLNGCDEKGEEWAKGCTKYSSKTGTPLVIYLHDEGHK